MQNKIIWVCYIDTRERTADIFTELLNEAFLFISEESYLDGETFVLARGSVIIYTSNSDSQPILLEVAVCI